jgi:hypothetical protein
MLDKAKGSVRKRAALIQELMLANVFHFYLDAKGRN